MISRTEQNWPDDVNVKSDPMLVERYAEETLQEYVERLMSSETQFDMETR